MSHWLSSLTNNVFVPYSSTHLIVLVIFCLIVIVLFMSRHWLRHEGRERMVRYTLAGILIICEVTLNAWYINEGLYNMKDSLPLELCSISLYMCVIMLFLKSRSIFTIVYFTGIGGATQALLTPVLFYNFPHYVFFEFFIAHMVIIVSILYMVWVNKCRPTFKSIFTAMLFLNMLVVIIYPINILTGGNYMFLARKPSTASLLDVLGPHPWYLLALEVVAVVLFMLLYLPFAIKKRPRNKATLIR